MPNPAKEMHDLNKIELTKKGVKTPKASEESVVEKFEKEAGESKPKSNKKSMSTADMASDFTAKIMFLAWAVVLVIMGIWMLRLIPGTGGFPESS